MDVSIGDVTIVNPEISTGLPIASLNRYPFQTEKYSTPVTKGVCLTA